MKITIGLSLKRELIEKIDEQRGLVSRSAFCEHELEKALKSYEVSSGPSAKENLG